MMRFVQSYARIPYMGLPINGPKWAEVRAIYARAHAHAYPHTPTRICMRTYTCSSFKETEHWRGGLSLRILSSEERLRRAPFLTVLGERERESERAIERATTLVGGRYAVRFLDSASLRVDAVGRLGKPVRDPG